MQMILWLSILQVSTVTAFLTNSKQQSFARRVITFKQAAHNKALVNDDDEFDVSFNNNNNLSNRKLVLGINKYSHDTSVCAADAETGEVLFFLEKERLTRKKHAAGTITQLVEAALDTIGGGVGLENIERIVVNNHHHRVLPLEKDMSHIQWQVGLGINDNEGDLDDDYNLLPFCRNKHELSHHLAHAYSAACQASFDRGLVVVMDGMGETFGAMAAAKHTQDTSYSHDLLQEETYQSIPSDIRERLSTSPFGWREGESAYVFEKDLEKNTIEVKPVFKRFIDEKSPPVLYNHGFENMDSLGAVYSRASSHIFGDWNACGKVMGLAPWNIKWADENTEKQNILSGSLYIEEGQENTNCKEPFKINRESLLSGQPVGSIMPKEDLDFDEDKEPSSLAKSAIHLAATMQGDLETVGLDFVSWLKEITGESNLCLTGGVALNSVLNGKIYQQLGFDNVFIPPYPGDEGIAVGCCAYGLFGNKATQIYESSHAPLWTSPLRPYLGPTYLDEEIEEIIDEALPWIEAEEVLNEDLILDMIAREISSGGVVAWFQGRSEAGPRALGHRSILADPRKKDLVKFINNEVKGRESFRPFAPSVLSEEVENWFEGITNNSNISPFMSMTTGVKAEKQTEIPAVTHIDGSSRLQTVDEDDEPTYHKMIRKFFDLTGVPMVLNTSFNTLKGEPIVETPRDAIKSFLNSFGGLEMLVLGKYVIRRRAADVGLLFEQDRSDGSIRKRKIPFRAGPYDFSTSSSIENPTELTVKFRMPDSLLHNERINDGWAEITSLDAEILGAIDGETGVTEILSSFSDEDGEPLDEDGVKQVIDSIAKLYDFTFIGW